MDSLISFLSERTQQVLLEGQSSEKGPVISGVRQGSVLGPILFFIFINDLPDNLNKKARMFADDCIVYREISLTKTNLLYKRTLIHLQHGNRRGEWTFTLRNVMCYVFPELNHL